MALATLDQARHFGYDPEVIAPTLQRAELRVRERIAHRASASAALLADTPPPSLSEFVLSVASRLAATAGNVAMGVVSEGAGGESVAYGAQAYAGVTGLTASEKERLDAMYPPGFQSLDLVQ